jgi:tRNA threonylcarbamoyladenosine biosynthesis protein TsaB
MDGSVQPGINLLVFDTSTERAVIALATMSGGTFATATDAARRHGRDLIPQLRNVLEQAELTVADVQLFAVGIGPGSYTGLRVGLMAAKTLAYVAGAALIGLDSLEVIARNAPADATKVSVVADAQRGDVYSASFARASAGEPLLRTRATMIEPVSAWAERLVAGEFLMGPALNAPKVRALLPDGVVLSEADSHFPTAAKLLECAHEAWLSGRRDDFWALEPLYLRRSSAEEQWDNRSASNQLETPNSRADQRAPELSMDPSTHLPGTP